MHITCPQEIHDQCCDLVTQKQIEEEMGQPYCPIHSPKGITCVCDCEEVHEKKCLVAKDDPPIKGPLAQYRAPQDEEN